MMHRTSACAINGLDMDIRLKLQLKVMICRLPLVEVGGDIDHGLAAEKYPGCGDLLVDLG